MTIGPPSHSIRRCSAASRTRRWWKSRTPVTWRRPSNRRRWQGHCGAGLRSFELRPRLQNSPSCRILALHRLSDGADVSRADFSTVPPTTPAHALLDAAVPDRPVVIHNTSEHALWLNAAALAMSRLTERPVADADEERGIIRDASGRPTGVLLEAAMQVAARAVAVRLPVEQQLAMVEAATHYLNGFGITSVVNATGDLAEIQLYAALRDRGALTVRTRTAFGAVAVQQRLAPAFLADLEQARRLYHDEWVSANLVKFFADGSTGLYPPLVYDSADYRALVMALDQRGYQI